MSVIPKFFWRNGQPWRDLHRRPWWRCGLTEEYAIELRPVKPGLGQGMMEEWNTGNQGYTAHLQQTMVAFKAYISLSPEISTPLLHQCSYHLQVEPIHSDHTYRRSRYAGKDVVLPDRINLSSFLPDSENFDLTKGYRSNELT